jgi:hypothetical protein
MFDFEAKKANDHVPFYPSEEIPGRNQMPPCTNGCGNEEIEQITKSNHPQLKNIRGLHPHLDGKTQIQFFFCKNCLNLFIIKIKMEQMAEGENLPLAA